MNKVKESFTVDMPFIQSDIQQAFVVTYYGESRLYVVPKENNVFWLSLVVLSSCTHAILKFSYPT